MTEKKNDLPHVCVIGLRGFPGVQGGVEKHCEALYPRMEGFRFTVYRRKPYLAADAPKQWNGIEFVDLPSTRIKGFEALFHTFIATLSAIRRRPDIIHIHNIGPGLFSPLIKLFGIKVVTTYHSANYEHKKWGAFARALLRFGERMTLRFSDRIIFVNQSKYLAQPQQIRDKSALILNGVVPAVPSEKTDYIESIGLKKGEYLLGVGRLTPEKGFEYLIRAANLSPQISAVAIAGGADHDEEYLESLRSFDTNGKVVFTGNLQGESLRQLYTHARAFVLSSVTEGFPLVLLEAMSYGLPVLVSDIDAVKPLLAASPDGFIPQEAVFRSADPDALREAIRRLTDGEIPSRQWPMDRFDWSAIASQTSKLFQSIF